MKIFLRNFYLKFISLSLKIKVLLFFVIIVLLSFFITAFYWRNDEKNNFNNLIVSNIKICALSFASAVNSGGLEFGSNNANHYNLAGDYEKRLKDTYNIFTLNYSGELSVVLYSVSSGIAPIKKLISFGAPPLYDDMAVKETLSLKNSHLGSVVTCLNNGYVSGYCPIFSRNGVITGIIQVTVPQKTIFVNHKDIKNKFIIMICVWTAIVFSFSFLLSKRLILPIKRMIHFCHGISKGDLSLSLPKTRWDEIGKLEDALNLMAKDLLNYHLKMEELNERLIESEKRSVVTQIAGGVAHEIKNFLMPLDGYLILLAPLIDEALVVNQPVKEKIHKYLGTIQSQVECIKNMAAQLSSISKPAKVKKEMVDLNELILSTVDMLSLTMAKVSRYSIIVDKSQSDISLKNHVLLICLDEKTPLINGNRQGLQQILINLILNAVDSVEENGKGSILIRTLFDQDANNITLYVKDTGTGISDEVKSNIFKPFFTTKGEHGTGLGLAIAQNIARIHDGVVEIESLLGEGTTVLVRFTSLDGY